MGRVGVGNGEGGAREWGGWGKGMGCRLPPLHWFAQLLYLYKNQEHTYNSLRNQYDTHVRNIKTNKIPNACFVLPQAPDGVCIHTWIV